MSALLDSNASYDGSQYLSVVDQRKALASIKVRRPKCVLIVTAYDGSASTDTKITGVLSSNSATSGAVFEPDHFHLRIDLPIHPCPRNPINIISIRLDVDPLGPLNLATRLLNQMNDPITLHTLADWPRYMASASTPEQFLLDLGGVLGVVLYPRSVSIPDDGRSLGKMQEQTAVMVDCLLSGLTSARMCQRPSPDLSAIERAVPEIAMLRLLAIRCCREKRGDEARYIAAASTLGRSLRAIVTHIVHERSATVNKHLEAMLRCEVLPAVAPHRRRSLRRPAPPRTPKPTNRRVYIRGKLRWVRAPHKTRPPCNHIALPTTPSGSASSPVQTALTAPTDAPLPHEQAVRAPGSPGPGVVVRIGAAGSYSIPGRPPPGWKSDDRDRPGVACRHSGSSDSAHPQPTSPPPAPNHQGRHARRLRSTPRRPDAAARAASSLSDRTSLTTVWSWTPVVQIGAHRNSRQVVGVRYAFIHAPVGQPPSSCAGRQESSDSRPPSCPIHVVSAVTVETIQSMRITCPVHLCVVPTEPPQSRMPVGHSGGVACPRTGAAPPAVPLQPAFAQKPPAEKPRLVVTRADEYVPDVFVNISPVPLSGGMAQPFAACGRRCRKLAPSARVFDLPLAKTTSNLIDVEALARDGLRDVLAPIMDVNTFEALFNDDATATRRRPLSRGMYQHRHALVENQVVEPVVIALPSGRRRAVANRFLLQTWCGTFLVEKKNGTGRFIIDARPINRAQAPPPDMGLPRMGDIIRDILRADVAAKTDGVSYFYQFPLARGIRPYFKIRLASGRGRYAEFQLKRMPMGWKYAPAIAQHVSNYLVEGCGRAWLDDFIIFGSHASFGENRSRFLERLSKYTVEVDDTELAGSSRLAALGLDFDLTEKQFRLDPAWVDKRLPKLEQYLTDASSGATTTTHRDFLEVMGILVWSSYVREIPLWEHAECLAALSAAASGVKDLDSPFQCPEYCHTNLRSWIDCVQRNEWVTPTTRPATFNNFLFSDASDSVAAFIKVCGDQITAGDAWSLPPEQKIYLSEVEAIARGAPHVDVPSTLFATDNQAAHYAMRKGHSSSYAANVMFRRAFGPVKPWSIWVPTYLQPSDRYTRGFKLPTLPSPIDAPVIDAIRFTQLNAYGYPNSKRSIDQRALCVAPNVRV